jgi:hypothetical protein
MPTIDVTSKDYLYLLGRGCIQLGGGLLPPENFKLLGFKKLTLNLFDKNYCNDSDKLLNINQN